MILLQAIIEGFVGPMEHLVAQHFTHCSWVGGVTVRRHLFRRMADNGQLQKHFSKISQAQLVSEPPQDNQENHISGIFQKVERRSCALVEEALASRAREHLIAEHGFLGLFFRGG
jgi:hypothetical protein